MKRSMYKIKDNGIHKIIGFLVLYVLKKLS